MEEPGHPRRWHILGVMVLSLLTVVLDNTILNVALKTIADPIEGIGASQSQLEWAINAYTLVFAGLLFTFGVLGDNTGRRRMLLIGLAVFGVSSLGSALAEDPVQLIIGRAFMGLGAAAIMPATLAIISNVFPPRERSRAIGIWAAGVGLGAAIGPVTGGLLIEHFWWGSIFLVNVPVVIVAVTLTAMLVPESRDPNPAGLDPIGVVLSIVALVALTYGIIRGGELATVGHPEVFLPALLGVVLLGVFVWHERRTDHPAFDVRYFRDARFSSAVALIGVVFFAMLGGLFFLTFYVQIVLGYSPLEAGLLMLPFAAAQLIFSPLSPRVTALFGAKRAAAASMFLATATMLPFAVFDEHAPVVLIMLLFFLQGVTQANINPPATTAIMDSLPREKAGVGSAMSNTMRQLGGALGVAVLGSVLSAVYRSHITPALTGLPPALRHEAGESLSGTIAVAEELGPQGAALLEPAKQAFLQGMHVTALCCAAVTLFGAVMVLIWLPGKGKGKGARAKASAAEAVPESAAS